MNQPKGFWRENLETVLICVIFVLFARTFVFQQSKIPTGSMENTLLVGDYILVNRFQYAPTIFDWERSLLPVRDVHRGDVVVFKYPENVETDYIKRVVGLPGDIVEIRGRQVLVNNKTVPEPYTVFKDNLRGQPPRFGPVRVPGQSYFMMGDNRDRSLDSRSWGFVPQSHLQGRAILIWWSYDEDRDDYKRTHFLERIRSIASKAVHLFSRSRWRRTFNLIH